MSGKDTLRLIAEELAQALVPLEAAVASPESFAALLRNMGWDFTGLVPPPVAALGAAAIDLRAALEAVLAGSPSFQELESLRSAIRDLVDDVRELADLPQGSFPSELEAAGFAQEFPARLVELLVITHLRNNHPRVETLLRVLGIVRVELSRGTGDRPAYVSRRLALPDLAELLRDPGLVLERVYGWGTADFRYQDVFEHVVDLVSNFGLDVYLEELDPRLVLVLEESVVVPGQPVRWSLKVPLIIGEVAGAPVETGIGLFALPARGAHLPGLSVLPYAEGDLQQRLQLSERVSLVIEAAADLTAGVGVVFRPNEPIELLTDMIPSAAGGVAPPSGGRVRVRLEVGEADGEPTVLLGIGGVGRIEVGRISLIGKAEVDSTGGRELSVELELLGATLHIGPDEADGFVRSLVPVEGTVRFDLALGLSAVHGFYFRGSAALQVSIPVHLAVGGITFESIILRAIPAGDKIPVEVGVSVGAQLGPLTVLVENMGLRATFSFPDEGGNVGPVDLDLGFKPPTGVGLSLDAGGFKGGGFLMFDSEKGEYAGALELDFKGMFSVKAIGIINTKMPDRSKGFSLLIVIATEFTPIQLSFGFTLNGVGGIYFGLNRRIVVAALAEGIRTNAVKSILFPENVIANISRIISDIKQFFPPQQGHFVVGPMAKLGWGTPPIITVELGLLLDLPDPMYAIVGVLKAVLPTEDDPILRLQVNFLGIVDFGHGYTFFRADLFDSRLLVYSITGTMAYLISWGEAKALALSVGGFHPDFRDIPTIPALPDGFRSMARIGISLLSDDNPRLKIESYFAITANTLQFGARVELYAEAGGFNVYGFLGYDVLFQRDPFRFVAKLSGGIALRRHSSVIAGVNISATLSGLTPWDARGKATLSLLFFSISVGFHATWGDPLQAIAAALEDLLNLLKRELADTRNWHADLPPNNHLHVSLRKIELPAETEMLVIHPAGVLTFSQRSLPLEDFLIAKFGTRKPLAENKFKITNANSDNATIPADFQSVREQFAPGNFLELSDSEKLSRKSFDNLPSGFKLSATADLLTTLPVVRDVEYELSYLRRERIVPSRGLIKLFVLAYDRLVKGSAVRQSGLAQQQTRVSLNAPPQVRLPQETFAVANAADLKSHATTASGPVLFSTQAEAYQHQQELIAQNPALAGQIQVVSHFELNPN